MPAIDKYLSAVQKNEASDLHLNDIHLNTGSAPIFRVHGMMRPPTSHALEAEEICNMLYGIMTNTARKTLDETGDADWAYEFQGIARFRCNGKIC